MCCRTDPSISHLDRFGAAGSRVWRRARAGPPRPSVPLTGHRHTGEHVARSYDGRHWAECALSRITHPNLTRMREYELENVGRLGAVGPSAVQSGRLGDDVPSECSYETRLG